VTSNGDWWKPGYPIDLRDPELQRRDATGPYGDFEARAGRIVARTTGLKTVLQDDNRTPATPDFRLEREGDVVAIGEVVTTSDPGRAEQLRAFARGDLEIESDGLACTWWVTVDPSAHRKDLNQSLVKLLASIEIAGDHLAFVGSLHSPKPDAYIDRLRALGVLEAVCDSGLRPGPGRVIGHPLGIGGPFDLDWHGFHDWLDGYLSSDICLRKRDKLVNSTPVEARHLFVGVTWTIPWSVLHALEHDAHELPLRPPSLPDGVTHLWLFGAELPSRCLSWWPDVGWLDTRQRWATQ
jgi:hypothetical protein